MAVRPQNSSTPQTQRALQGNRPQDDFAVELIDLDSNVVTLINASGESRRYAVNVYKGNQNITDSLGAEKVRALGATLGNQNLSKTNGRHFYSALNKTKIGNGQSDIQQDDLSTLLTKTVTVLDGSEVTFEDNTKMSVADAANSVAIQRFQNMNAHGAVRLEPRPVQGANANPGADPANGAAGGRVNRQNDSQAIPTIASIRNEINGRQKTGDDSLDLAIAKQLNQMPNLTKRAGNIFGANNLQFNGQDVTEIQTQMQVDIKGYLNNSQNVNSIINDNNGEMFNKIQDSLKVLQNHPSSSDVLFNDQDEGEITHLITANSSELNRKEKTSLILLYSNYISNDTDDKVLDDTYVHLFVRTYSKLGLNYQVAITDDSNQPEFISPDRAKTFNPRTCVLLHRQSNNNPITKYQGYNRNPVVVPMDGNVEDANQNIQAVNQVNGNNDDDADEVNEVNGDNNDAEEIDEESEDDDEAPAIVNAGGVQQLGETSALVRLAVNLKGANVEATRAYNGLSKEAFPNLSEEQFKTLAGQVYGKFYELMQKDNRLCGTQENGHATHTKWGEEVFTTGKLIQDGIEYSPGASLDELKQYRIRAMEAIKYPSYA
jgi:hypothetical protein